MNATDALINTTICVSAAIEFPNSSKPLHRPLFSPTAYKVTKPALNATDALINNTICVSAAIEFPNSSKPLHHPLFSPTAYKVTKPVFIVT